MNETFMQAITGEEVRENMNRISVRRTLFILAAIMMFTLNPVSVKANTNKDLSIATTYISRHYPGYKVRKTKHDEAANSQGKADCLR